MVFSDLDGTLLATDKTLSPRTRRALVELGEQGIEFVPCSGRALTGIPEELLSLDACHYAVCSNGAKILRDEDGETLHEVLLGACCARQLWERVRTLDVTFDIFADGKIWSSRPAFERMDSFGIDAYTLKAVKGFRTVTDETCDEILDRLERDGGKVERVTLFWHTEEDRDAVIAAIGEDPTLAWTTSVPHDIEVLDCGCGKGAALKWLCHHLGIPIEDSLAFGDGLNDAPLLAAAGLGVAMENAESETKAAADIVGPSNDEDGVAQMLERLLEKRSLD